MGNDGPANGRGVSAGDRLNEEEWLSILACPVCDERPKLEKRGDLLICTLRGHGFMIVDGIPQMLPENALPPEKVKELTHES